MKILLIVLSLFIGSLPGLAATPSVAKPLPPEAVEALHTGRKYILLSIEPENWRNRDYFPLKRKEDHHGYQILGSRVLRDDASRIVPLNTVSAAIRAHREPTHSCFEPCHSLRVITAKKGTYDFVTCFSCGALRVYRGDTVIGDVGIPDSQKRWDALLLQAGIRLAKPRQSP